MPENDVEFKENVKKSFLKVKEDINTINSDCKNNQSTINEIKNKIVDLNEKINKLVFLIEKSDKKDSFFLENSKGNRGVVNNQQQSTTMINNQQQSTTMINKQQQSTTMINKQQTTLLEEDNKTLLNHEFMKKIKSLTDREFSIFIKVYELSATKDGVTFSDIANLLKLTEGTIRGSVTRIIAKQLPLVKERFFNRKSSLFIEHDFFSPPLLPEIIKTRNALTQTTLNTTLDSQEFV